MVDIEKPRKTLAFDDKKCNNLYKELVEVFQKHKPTVGELLIAYGNLGYTLGASVGGYKDKGPSTEELEKLYYSEPGNIAVALMLQSMTVVSWYSEWEQISLQDTKDKGENTQ